MRQDQKTIGSRNNSLHKRAKGGAGSSAARLLCSPVSLLSHILVAVSAFHFGFVAGRHGQIASTNKDFPSSAQRMELEQSSGAGAGAGDDVVPNSLNGLIAGMGRVPRDEFAQQYNVGVPLDKTEKGNEEVLILYSSSSSLPKKNKKKKTKKTAKNPSSLLASSSSYYSAKDGTENCHVMKVILTQPRKPNECIAIMGQWESYHVHKFMRLPAQDKAGHQRKGSILSPNLPMRYVARAQQASGSLTRVPTFQQSQAYWNMLIEYMHKLDATMERLKPLAQQAAGHTNTIVVMVCNHGQSNLLFNFCCAARARGLDLSHILLFATDDETVQLGQRLGLHVFDVQDAFGDMPKGAAKRYADKAFTGMMMAKVYCVHLINALGYDLLFQDVDLVWRRNPLDYFADHDLDFDMIFQDDGARSARYAPYSPNTGFYFVRHNERTEYFLSVFMRMGDIIQLSGSHQGALTAILSEHASWRGLHVKVFGRDDEDGLLFPGGFTYHKRKDFMKNMAQGKVSPYIFHMSWTLNKDNKRKFFQQLGEWYLKPECENKKVAEIGGGSDLSSDCCSAEPIVVCHYRDKPSKIPCKNSPPIDKGKPSFW